jgi:23S rRNA (cytidine2498-2'-O)-methyltransferase
MEPGPGELCVDLGAAPGGWSFGLLQRGTKVIAVDPARLRADLAGHGRLEHVAGNAFQFQPRDPVDWLFCDMAYRPLEVASMLARWARRRLAAILVANIKLPMRTKAEHVLKVRALLEDGGWSNLRTRQLYHDRDEITVTAQRR